VVTCTPRACRCRLTVPRIFSPSPCSSSKCRNLHTAVSSGAGSCLNRSPRTALSPASHTGLFHRRVLQIEPLLQEIHTQHTFHSHRWPPVPRFRIVWLNQRAQLAPRDNLLHLFQKHLSSCLFVYCQNHSLSPESFVVCLSVSSGGNLLYIPLVWLFGRSQDAVALENLTLRQQLAIYKLKKKRPRLIRRDR
jgi:hypothetical protein